MKHAIHHIHFVGIGGSGMSGIAEVMHNLGYVITGSDLADGAVLRRLQTLGIAIHVGHAAAHIAGADAVVTSTAVQADNPEVLAALARSIPIVPRAMMLAELMKLKQGIAIAGTHGKTTTTSLVASVLAAAGLDPTFVIGGRLNSAGAHARLGQGEYIVVEADESDGTFLLYDTSIALITNVDPDHLDHWGTRDAFYDAFVTFGNEAREAVVISSDDPGAQRVAAALSHPHVVTFGEDASADVRVSEITTEGPVSFTLTHQGVSAPGRLAVPGAHNAVNAAGAVAVLLTLGYDLEPALRAVEGFAGTVRRFELHGVRRGVSVYDDYAHHPTEVAAALAAARSVVGAGRLIAIQQPHTYSRTQEMYREFADVLETLADHTVVLDVYGAREDPVPGVTGELVSGAFRDADRVHFVADWQQAADYTASVARSGDYVITLGCGNVHLIIPQVLEALAAKAQD